jgi:RNA polymerase sigma-54 factor
MDLATRNNMEMRQLRTLAMTVQMRQAIGMLKLNNIELSKHVERLVAGNPAISMMPLQPPAGREAPAAAIRATTGPGGGNGAAEAMLAAPESGLHSHVLHQIGMAFRDRAERRIAESFAESLEPSGWLGRGPAEVARDMGCSAELAEAVLARLRQFEPAGLFAANLADCLRLQAEDRGLMSATMSVVLDHLDLVGRGQLDALARLADTTEAKIAKVLRQLRSFDPKPGAAFGAGPAPIRPPDLIITPHGADGWNVDLNHATTPRLLVHEPDAATMPDAEARARALAEARWLERTVSRRNATTLKVAAAVVQRQSRFLRNGPAELKPLTLAEIARATDLHESTVSRVTCELLAETPRGTLLLREFFSAAVSSNTGQADIAAGAVRYEIARMIQAEAPHRPMSDVEIVRELADRGIRVARRTVAKYRDMLRIPGSAARRRRFRLDQRR